MLYYGNTYSLRRKERGYGQGKTAMQVGQGRHQGQLQGIEEDRLRAALRLPEVRARGEEGGVPVQA